MCTEANTHMHAHTHTRTQTNSHLLQLRLCIYVFSGEASEERERKKGGFGRWKIKWKVSAEAGKECVLCNIIQVVQMQLVLMSVGVKKWKRNKVHV